MFNREIKVGFVKKPKAASENPEEEPTYSPEAVSAAVQEVVDKIGRTVVTAFLIIIAADTARQVIVKQTKEGVA